ncbi:MAG: hypothetical protein R3B07_15290 [Polyangiaceae bacterium]
MKAKLGLALGLVALGTGLSAGQARAESTPETHDGLYLRLSIGGGYARDKFEYTGFFGGDAEGIGQGSSGLLEVMLGGTVAKGLVVGGGGSLERVANPKVEIDGVDVSEDYSLGTLFTWGPMIDWYPDPNGGFHLGGMIGAAALNTKDGTGDEVNSDAVGGGGEFFIGYEWWVAAEWGVGVAARLFSAMLVDELVIGRVTHSWTSGGVVFTGTFH